MECKSPSASQCIYPALTRIYLSIILCGIYYYLWIHGIPRWRGYRIRQETVSLADGGSLTHRLVQVPIQQLDDWDRTHDPLGRDLDHGVESGGYENSSEGVTSVKEEAKV